MAFTPTLYNSVCYPSVASAADAYFSSIAPSLLVSGTTSYQLYYLPIAGVWNLRKVTISSAGVPTVNFTVPVAPPTFPNCDLTQNYFDGMQIGWGVVAAMFGAYAIVFLKKAFHV